uniref:Uncharacterized protein n=1 Tax=Alexandrium catenella TaxID=2925 RepID=A0A7S1LBH7_ALECA
MQVRSLLAALSLLVSMAFGEFVGLRGGSMNSALAGQEPSLHGQMSAMMADDGEDDPADSQGGFMQEEGGSNSAYIQDSAASLSAALGPRWDGTKLEADARRKTDALLKGIAGHNAVGSLSRMLGALP